MTQFNKALIVPIVSFILLNVKLIFGVEVPSEYADLAADFILGIVSLVGFFLHPHKQ